MKAMIVVAGCDDSSRFIVDVDGRELIGVIAVAQACNRAAREYRPCKPVMSIMNATTMDLLVGDEIQFDYPADGEWRKIFIEAGLPVPKECEEEDE